MADYLISPPSKSDWHLLPTELETLLEQDWAGARVEQLTDDQGIHSLAFTLDIDGERLDGRLTKDGAVVALDGDVRAAASFARWFRGRVPTEQPLLFYDLGYSADVALGPETTEAEIAAPFLAS